MKIGQLYSQTEVELPNKPEVVKFSFESFFLRKIICLPHPFK